MTHFTLIANRPVRLARAWTLGLLALAVGSLVFWGLRLGSMPQSVPQLRFVTTPGLAALSPDGLGRALGVVAQPDSAPTTAPAARSALSLAGVMARGQGRGAALISIDGQKAQAFETGQEVQAGLYVLAVEPRVVRLGSSPQGPVTDTLTLLPPTLPQN